MFVYVFPITALLLSFMALLSSVRFLFSRQGGYWILPTLISIVLCFYNLNNLLVIGEAGFANYVPTVISTLPTVLSFLWYIMVIVFHYALKLAIPENKYLNDSIKNKKESVYLEKFESRRNKFKRRNRYESESSKTKVPSVPAYKNGTIDFD